MTAENDFPYDLSEHAKLRFSDRKIDLQWIVRTLSEPELLEPHPEDATCQCAYKAIPEADNRVLKVVYNATNQPWRIVTVHFDRRMRGKL